MPPTSTCDAAATQGMRASFRPKCCPLKFEEPVSRRPRSCKGDGRFSADEPGTTVAGIALGWKREADRLTHNHCGRECSGLFEHGLPIDPRRPVRNIPDRPTLFFSDERGAYSGPASRRRSGGHGGVRGLYWLLYACLYQTRLSSPLMIAKMAVPYAASAIGERLCQLVMSVCQSPIPFPHRS
jgi:hypothetical protein